jgi:hypothetical protein
VNIPVTMNPEQISHVARRMRAESPAARVIAQNHPMKRNFGALHSKVDMKDRQLGFPAKER